MHLIHLLPRLEKLDLGNCTNWPATSFDTTGRLGDLQQLTLVCGEDGEGFHTMLLRLTRLERLELKQWTLPDSLADALPRMEKPRSLLIWPQTSSMVAKTNRNSLRSCLSAGPNLQRLTWIVGCKQVVHCGSPVARNGLARALQQLAPNVHISFDPGRLCRCTPTSCTTAALCLCPLPPLWSIRILAMSVQVQELVLEPTRLL